MSTELFGKIKALIVAKGGIADLETEGMTAQEVKQYAEIAHLYYGVTPNDALAALASPDHLPELLRDALDSNSADDVSVVEDVYVEPQGDDTLAAPDETVEADFADEQEDTSTEDTTTEESDAGVGEDEVTEGDAPTIPEDGADQPTE